MCVMNFDVLFFRRFYHAAVLCEFVYIFLLFTFYFCSDEFILFCFAIFFAMVFTCTLCKSLSLYAHWRVTENREMLEPFPYICSFLLIFFLTFWFFSTFSLVDN